MLLLTVLSSLLLLAPSDTLRAPSASDTPSRDLDVITGTPHTLDVSGVAGGETTLMQPAGGAILLGAGLIERSDRPCRMYFYWWREDDSSRPQNVFHTELNICRNDADGIKRATVGRDLPYAPSGSDHVLQGSTFLAAHGLRVCLNRGGDRVKGLRLFGSTINQDNSGEVRRDPALQRDFERTNCNTWSPARRCPAGEVIVGVVVHHGDPDRVGASIHGLAPKCATVTVQN